MTGSAELIARGLVSDMSLEFDLQMLQFNIHAEHLIEGKYYDMEMQIIHRIIPRYLPRSSKWSNSYLIISVFFEVRPRNANNTFLDSLNINTLDGITNMSLAEYFNGLEPNYIYYNGSLSTPPCNENAHRFLMTDIQYMSEAQLRDFTYYYEGNYRGLPKTSRVVPIKITKRMARSLSNFGEGLYPSIIIILLSILILL